MSDIVERLRFLGTGEPLRGPLMVEAALEIERLRANLAAEQAERQLCNKEAVEDWAAMKADRDALRAQRDATAMEAAKALHEMQAEVERLRAGIREIHQRLKRGEQTQDHGDAGNIACILDALTDDPPLDSLS